MRIFESDSITPDPELSVGLPASHGRQYDGTARMTCTFTVVSPGLAQTVMHDPRITSIAAMYGLITHIVCDEFRGDLAAARTAWIDGATDATARKRRAKNPDFLTYEDSDGQYLDFHALRVTFGTALARAGVRLQVAQRLMRHSTPVLTANVYTRLELHDLRGAVDNLGAKPEPRARRA